MKHRKIYGLSILALSLFSTVQAETIWYNPFDAGYPVVQNQAWQEELFGTYQRIPDRAKQNLREVLWNLSLNSSGLALYFNTDAPTLTVRYEVDQDIAMPHMPATGVTGVDLYRVSSDGLAQDFCWGNWHFGDTVRYTFNGLETPEKGETFEYHLNLPLFNNVQGLEIGVPEGSNLTFLPRKEDKPIVIYGTSIVHGACASRPGMSWANITRRNLKDYPFINLGFSGNGKLEPAMIDLLNEIDAELYILDCMPNLNGNKPDEAHQLVLDAVRQIRSKSKTPILLIEHAGYSDANTNPHRREIYTRLNKEQNKAYQELREEGIENLYYITHDELGLTPDSWVDYVHPTDLGAIQYSTVVISKIKEILAEKRF